MNREFRARSYNLDSLEELVTSLIDASSRGAVIIVEGQRDRDALRMLGATGPVVTVSQKLSLNLAEEAAQRYDEIVLLTDWDCKGEELAHSMESWLRHTGCTVDTETRRRLKQLVRKEIKDVESLWTYMSRVRELYGTVDSGDSAAGRE